MNGNSSKQVLLSVLGIAILVVAVVGVSFAFFSYTKTGTQNNTITTGQIYTYLTNGTQMTLSNAMPVADPSSAVSTSTGEVGALTFTVTGHNESADTIHYSIYLAPGTMPTGGSRTAGTVLADSDIGIAMTSSGTGAADPIPFANPSATPDPIAATTVGSIGSLANGEVLLGSGTFAPTTTGTGTDIVHSYTINLWVRSETVKISDTDAEVNGVTTKYCASKGNTNKTPIDGTEGNTTETKHGCEQNLPYYEDTWYAVKIRVVANTTEANVSYNYS